MIKVIITDDHPVVRTGLKQILDKCSDIEVVDEASQGSELIALVMKNEYDVVLLDISMPGRNGLEILQQVKKLNPDIAILILSIYPEEQYAVRAIKSGAAGYITKDSIPDELITAIRKVSNGGKYITPSVAEKLAYALDEISDKSFHEKLSDREYEVMCMIAEGIAVAAIAKELLLSPKTISTYRERILCKLKLKNTSDIIRYAIKEKLVE